MNCEDNVFLKFKRTKLKDKLRKDITGSDFRVIFQLMNNTRLIQTFAFKGLTH